MIMNEKSLNWGWIEEKLVEIKMYEFAKTCFALIEYWFGIIAPINYELLPEEFQIKATNKVLNNYLI